VIACDAAGAQEQLLQQVRLAFAGTVKAG
jgi:hypothetical protein